MKEQLINLAKAKNFQPEWINSFPSDMQNNICYYLWMCELQKWLREKHNIHILIHYNVFSEKYRIEYIIHMDRELEEEYPEVKTFEQALEKGLFEALKLIKL